MTRLKDVHLPKLKRYADFREMLDKQKDIDAVFVATPDHMHATIALAAMDLKKAVYVQKPLTWSVAEARQLSKRAQETKVATQMGNQGHSTDDARTVIEYIQSGAIGDVREVHIWTNRPLGFWPQGVPRPEPLESVRTRSWLERPRRQRPPSRIARRRSDTDAARTQLEFLPRRRARSPISPDLSSVQLARLGRLGHGRDRRHGRASHRPLDVGARPRLSDDHRNNLHAVQRRFLSARHANFLRISSARFEATRQAHVVRRRPAPSQAGRVPDNEQLNKGGGALLVGTKGKLLHDTYGLRPRLLPASLHETSARRRENCRASPAKITN